MLDADLLSFIRGSIRSTGALEPGLPLEERSWLYLLRLAAFSVLIIAIVRKNFQK